LSVQDGQTLVNTLAIAIDEGNLTFTEERTGVVVSQRGELDHWSKGESMPVNLSFTIKFDEYASKTTQAIVTADAGGAVTDFSLRDFLRNGGGLLESTNGRNDIFTTDLLFTVANPAVTGDESEVLSFTDFYADSLSFSEGDEYNTIQVSGRALLETPASARA
jgi:hypothetical protein